MPVYKIYIEELASKTGDTDHLLNLLGINYQAYTNDQKEEEGAFTFAMVDIRDEKKGLYRQRFYHLKKINDVGLIESLPEKIVINTNLDLWEWWSSSEKKLTTSEEHQPPTPLNLDLPLIEDVEVLPDRISFSVDSATPAPVYIKFSHSPYWQATALNDSSFASQPIRVTPGNMMIYAAGDVELNWITPPYLRMFGPLSLATLIGTLATLIIAKWNKKL